ncbi:MAG: 30S ribosomal protein S2, partial [Pseudomonadota bacterium]
VAVVDTNCDPGEIDFPIPGNDDAARAIGLYCELVSNAVLAGISASAVTGEEAEPLMEPLPAEPETAPPSDAPAPAQAPTPANAPAEAAGTAPAQETPADAADGSSTDAQETSPTPA